MGRLEHAMSIGLRSGRRIRPAASLRHLKAGGHHPNTVLIRFAVYCYQALGERVPPVILGRSSYMNVLIPIIGITCIGLLIYYIYILMRSDS